MVSAVAAAVFMFGIGSAPFRPCPHHHGESHSAVASSPHSKDRADQLHATHDATHTMAAADRHTSADGQVEPCTCLSQCEAASAEPMSPTLTDLVQHDPPVSRSGLRAPHSILPRAPLPRVLPFPNPPPLPA